MRSKHIRRQITADCANPREDHATSQVTDDPPLHIRAVPHAHASSKLTPMDRPDLFETLLDKIAAEICETIKCRFCLVTERTAYFLCVIAFVDDTTGAICFTDLTTVTSFAPFSKMLDTSPISSKMQRSKGCAHVTIGLGGVIDLAQSGSAKAMLPKKTVGLPEVVFLNTSGGLASGDMLEFGLELRPGTHALATTQTAERAYRAEESPARAHVTLQVGENGWLDWLPQETILFNGSQLDRATEVNLARGAGCLLLEMIVLGRLAMGEELSHLHLTDRRVVRQAGRVVHHDALALDDRELTRLENPAMLQGARAIATLVMISADAPDRLRTARDVLNEAGVTSAASAPSGRLVIRMLATDGWPLRRQVNRLLLTLRPDPLPRIWQI